MAVLKEWHTFDGQKGSRGIQHYERGREIKKEDGTKLTRIYGEWDKFDIDIKLGETGISKYLPPSTHNLSVLARWIPPIY